MVSYGFASDLFLAPSIDDKNLAVVISRFNRVVEIMKILVDQIRVLGTSNIRANVVLAFLPLCRDNATTRFLGIPRVPLPRIRLPELPIPHSREQTRSVRRSPIPKQARLLLPQPNTSGPYQARHEATLPTGAAAAVARTHAVPGNRRLQLLEGL